MKNLGIISSGVVFVVSMVATASAAEPSAPISKASLGSMGLGSIQLMSDDEGLGVRGKGAFFGGFGGHKFKIHSFFLHKKFDHRKSFDHKISHKSFGGHKGGGMIWQPKKMVWNFGGGIKLH